MSRVLADLCDLIIDCEHRTAPPVEDGPYPLIRTPDVGVGRLLFDRAQRVTQETYEAWTKRAIPRSGDLVLAREAPVGNVGIIPPGFQPVLGQRTVLIRPNATKIDPMYLNYLLSGPEMRAWMDGVSIGATVAHLNMFDIRSMELPPLPALTTQRKIAAILSAYDDLIEINKRRINLLGEMAQRTYREWFVDLRYPGHDGVPLVDSELGPIPQGWEVRSLGTMCGLVQAGGTPLRSNRSYWTEATVDWYKTGELQDCFLFGSAERVSATAVSDRKTRVFPTGTILMAIYGSPTGGRLGVLAREGACNQAALALIGRDVPQTVLYYMLMGLRGHFNSIAQGAAQQNISKEKVEAARVVCPPPPLCLAADALLAPVFERRRGLDETIANLRKTRDLLLPDLVSGEIDVDDLKVAVDEPAA